MVNFRGVFGRDFIAYLRGILCTTYKFGPGGQLCQDSERSRFPSHYLCTRAWNYYFDSYRFEDGDPGFQNHPL